MNADVRIFKDKDALSRAGAEQVVDAATYAIKTRGRFLVALSGGGTPEGTYRLLASEPYRSKIDWAHTFVFWGDERCVPPEDEGSNYHQAYKILLKHVPIPDENLLRIKGELAPDEAADAYAQILKKFAVPGFDWPRFDLLLLGMGEDGHTASLFPGSPLEANSPALAVIADYQGRPARRVTLTPPVFNNARRIMFLVTGESKASTLREVLRGAHQPGLYPAQRIHPTDGQVTWLVDEAAGNNL